MGTEGRTVQDLCGFAMKSASCGRGLSKAEVKSLIWEKVNKMWQDKWDSEEKRRYLYNIQKSVNVKIRYSGQRKDEPILLRLGHSALNKTMKLIGKHPTTVVRGRMNQFR